MRPGSIRGVPTVVLLVFALVSPAFSGDPYEAEAEGLFTLVVASRPIPPIPAQVPIEVEVGAREPTKVEFLAIMAERGQRGPQILREAQGSTDWWFATLTPAADLGKSVGVADVLPSNLKIIFKLRDSREAVAHRVVTLASGDDLLPSPPPISFNDIEINGACVVFVGIPADEIEPEDVEYVTLAQ